MGRIFIASTILLLSACAHQSLTWDHTKQAAQHAALHPSVWAPLAGAGLFSIGNLDKSTSKETSEDNPLFGSRKTAEKASSDLKGLLTDVAILSAFVAPVPKDDNAIEHYGEHLAVIFIGFDVNFMITDGLKNSISRERPNKEDDKSFPSYNASKAFTAAGFASKNFHRAWGHSNTTQWADAGIYTAASLEAYSRVEVEKHYPSDVLVGAAIGSFIARFLDELLLNDKENVSLSSYYDGRTIIFRLNQRF